jgi:hypothetical protein
MAETSESFQLKSYACLYCRFWRRRSRAKAGKDVSNIEHDSYPNLLVESLTRDETAKVLHQPSPDGAPWEPNLKAQDPLWGRHESITCLDERDDSTPDNWIPRHPVRLPRE